MEMEIKHRSKIKRERNRDNKETRPFAKLSYARIPVQKACFVMDAIRGKDVESALAILQYNPRYASSASNGPIMKRIQPRAQGRAYRINKRMSHLTVILDER